MEFSYDTPLSRSSRDLEPMYLQSYIVDTQQRLLSDILTADPLLRIFCTYHYRIQALRALVRLVDKPIDELTITYRNPYYQGFVILGQVLRKQHRREQRDAYPTWNRRRSLSIYGINGISYSQLMPTVIASYAYPVGINSVPVTWAKYWNATLGVYEYQFSFDDLVKLARRLTSLGSYYQRNFTFNRYGYHTLTGLEISEDLVKYQLSNCFYQSYPSSRTMRLDRAVVTIRRGGPYSATSATVDISGLDGLVIDNYPAYPKLPWITHAESLVIRKNDISSDPTISDPLIRKLRLSLGFKMSEFRPAFYHTQAKAMNDVIADISSNFENLVESPELVTLLNAYIFGDDVKRFNKAFEASPVFERLSMVVKLISGAILLWNFALRPTLKAVQGLVRKIVQPVRGEGSMEFQTYSKSDLPTGLLTLITQKISLHGHSIDDVEYFDIVFRSTVTSTMSYSALVSALFEQFPLLRAHVLPSPSQIWATGHLTFLLDMAIPIQKYWEAHEALLASATIPFRVGHTASIRLTMKSGYTLNGFFRSRESNFLTDPPGDTWLQAPGASTLLIPLGLSVIL